MKRFLFDKVWFTEHQSKLLWLLNTPLIKIWFRWVLRIRKYDCRDKITEITPNSFSWGDRYFKKKGKWYLERTTDFRCHSKYSKRLYYAFYPLWYLFHCWDIVVNFLRLSALNLGFDTLTVYPNPGVGAGVAVDGEVRRSGVNETFLAIRSGAGTHEGATNISDRAFVGVGASGSTNQYNNLGRFITLFNTSSIPALANIIAASYSLFCIETRDALGVLAHRMVTSHPALDTTLAISDYANLGNVAQATDIVPSAVINEYKIWTLNPTGLSNISKTSNSRFGLRTVNDADGVAPPTWLSHEGSHRSYYTVDRFGTTEDPRLVVTHTSPIGRILLLATDQRHFIAKITLIANDLGGLIGKATLMANDLVSFIGKATLITKDLRIFAGKIIATTFDILGLAVATAKIKAIVKDIKIRFRIK